MIQRIKNKFLRTLFLLSRLFPFVIRFYYFFFYTRFDREQKAVIMGRHRFADTNDYETGTSTILRRNIHRLEKGLIQKPRKEFFAISYIEETLVAYKQAMMERNGNINEELCWATDVLNQYFDVCGNHPLIDQLRLEINSIPPLETYIQPDRASAFHPYKRDLSQSPPVEFQSLLSLAQQRRSVRFFLQKPVPRYIVEQAVKVAGLSPSACNRQPFEFRFFDNPEMRSKIAALPGGTKGFAEQFPIIGVVLGNLAHYYDEKDRHVIYIDSSLATMSLILALETLGLSSCCINWPDIEEDEAKAEAVLNLKPYERPIMFLAIGYPDPEALVPYSAKKPMEQICRWNDLG